MVAATSRPDLIDAALLRPGRLDRLVFCGECCGVAGAGATAASAGAMASCCSPAISLLTCLLFCQVLVVLPGAWHARACSHLRRVVALRPHIAGFPSPLERGAILRALSRGVALAPDVDLSLVGARCAARWGAGVLASGPWRGRSAHPQRRRASCAPGRPPAGTALARLQTGSYLSLILRVLAPPSLSRSRLGPCCLAVQVGYNAEFYSGADLAALLAEAQLAAVHEALEAEEAEHAAASAAAAAADGEGEAGTAVAARRPHTHPKPHARTAPRPPVIQARHLQAALAAARPSVPEAERERLEAVYARFRQDRQPGQAAGVDKGKGKLVSWA